jgi:acyl-coenzyme A synthetase/AMP-(fatty) acid ligase
MSSPGPRAAARDPLPLIGHEAPQRIAAYRRGIPVTAAQLLADALRLAARMPDASSVLNACGNRYHFAVALLAAVMRGQVTLLPPTTTPNVIASLKRQSPDAYCVGDDAACDIDLPRCDLAFEGHRNADTASFDVPLIAADQLVARIFTSGSTGEPQAHAKTWGGLHADMAAEKRRLGIAAGETILGTVPPQHMFGFESTVLLPLITGAALTAERLYLPAEIDEAIARVPAPRTLFTTPFHLKAWLAGTDPQPLERIVSATAPLSAALAREAEQRTGATLYEIYGCTEAGQVATRRTATTEAWELLEGLKLREAHGQAIVSGGHVEEPTPLMDVIEIDPDGQHFILHGRFADVVNIAGKRSSLAYLDRQLLSIPGVRDGVFFMPDEAEADGVTRLTAFAVAPGLGTRDVLDALRTRIDAAFMPRPLHLVESLPRALTGKLPRETLRALAAQLRSSRP